MKTDSAFTFDELGIPNNYLNMHELLSIEEKLQEVYERKANVLREIFNGESPIANPTQNEELDDITCLEASLMSKAEELRTSIEADRITQENDNNFSQNTENDFDNLRDNQEQSHDEDLER